MKASDFHNDFVWGVATAAYQIEDVTAEDGRGQSIWDTFCSEPGKVENSDTGEVAWDHYYRWQGDLDLIQSLDVRLYRFSVAWPRIFPEGIGQLNEQGLDVYDCLVDGLLQRGLEPSVTLYHWNLPQVLQNWGGRGNCDTAGAFANYADAVTKRLGNRVSYYATFNEPWCISILSHAIGEYALGMHDMGLALQVSYNLYIAHGLALPHMRANAPKAQHGIVFNLTLSDPRVLN